jgi:hypothetical protein
VFGKRADEAIAMLSSFKWCDPKKVQTEINASAEGKPKRGSFEITVTTDDGTEFLVWSGFNKGPPRKEKFPDKETLAAEVDKLLK